MAKEEALTFDGTVIDVMPNATFKIKLDDMDLEVLGHVSGKLRKNKIRILLGDKVTVEMSPYDLSKARITYRR
jgi:translation initiation factor IF-1